MRRVAGIALIVLMAACTDKDKIPSDVLPRDKMERVMWDMVQADQYVATYLTKDTVIAKDSAAFRKDSTAAAKRMDIAKDFAKARLKVETLKLYAQVFSVNKVSREEFDRSYKFYQRRPDLTRNMFDSLIAKGNRLRTENYNRPPSSSAPAGSVPPQTPPSIPPTSTNTIKTNVPGGLIKDRAVGNRPPMMQHAPGYLTPGGKPMVAPGSAMPAPSETRPLPRGLLRNKSADSVIRKDKKQ